MTTSTVKQPKLSSDTKEALKTILTIFGFVASFALLVILMFWRLDSNRQEAIAAYDAELASVQATNTPVFKEYADDLKQYGVSLSAREYDRLFYSGDEFVAPVNGVPKQLSVSFGSSGEPAYLLADGAVLAEVELAPAIEPSKDYRRYDWNYFLTLGPADE
jgi:hypothetical protein